MKNSLVLILLFISKVSLSSELVRLTPSQRFILDQNFQREVSQVMARLGSGDIVGNGGGLTEQNFISAYYNTQTAIQNCLDNFECGVTDEERKVLKEIDSVYIEKFNQERPLIFLNEEVANGFFKSEEDQATRIAKTGFTAESPIFINLNEAASISTNISAMIGIIIHELGHQTGIANHSALDQVGAKVRNLWASKSKIYKFELKSGDLDVRLFSSEVNYITSKLSYTFNGETKSLNYDIFNEIKCENNSEVYGFNLSNGHWSRPISTDRRSQVALNYWIEIYCKDLNGQINTTESDLTLTFRFHSFNRNRPKLRSIRVKVD